MENLDNVSISEKRRLTDEDFDIELNRTLVTLVKDLQIC